MCDASDYAIGAVLGQRVGKKLILFLTVNSRGTSYYERIKLNFIHYGSNTLESAQRNQKKSF